MGYKVIIVLSGPALLFFVLPWDSYSKEVEQLQDFLLEFLIPGFWSVHRWRATFHIPSPSSFLPNSLMIKTKTVKFLLCVASLCLSCLFGFSFLRDTPIPGRLLINHLNLHIRNNFCSIINGTTILSRIPYW